MSDAMLRTQLANGSLIRLRQNVYLTAAKWPDSPRQQYILRARAEQTAHPNGVISHGSAAAILGLPHPGPGEWSDGPVVMTVEAGSRPSRSGVVYRRATLPPTQVVADAAGYRMTSIARTAIDVAAGLELPQSLVVLDAAARLACGAFVSRIRRQDFRNPRLVAAVRELMTEAAQTTRRVRIQPAIALTEPCRESPIESLAAGHFHLAGIPTPLFQEPVRTPFGVVYPDCLWPEQRLIGEADGAVKYSDAAAMIGEKEREQVLRDLGYGVVRWLGKEIAFRPAVVVERVWRELDAR